ncbi:MAG: hypothetical protein AUG49_21070 [Catenulispora sp. 13_1_20CM_3_70_7]|nr:MAG: hypothetical protein AUG49_21070 [Catenulispora sp. 13_1_20CM_3_70_7]
MPSTVSVVAARIVSRRRASTPATEASRPMRSAVATETVCSSSSSTTRPSGSARQRAASSAERAGSEGSAAGGSKPSSAASARTDRSW